MNIMYTPYLEQKSRERKKCVLYTGYLKVPAFLKLFIAIKNSHLVITSLTMFQPLDKHDLYMKGNHHLYFS